jgi:hypothetical protein
MIAGCKLERDALIAAGFGLGNFRWAEMDGGGELMLMVVVWCRQGGC